MAKSRWTAEGGFSLLEVLIASTIMVSGIASLAQLFTMSIRSNHSARSTTFASVLAQQKMEQLRGLTWGFDAIGLPMSDSSADITVEPELSTGGTGLQPSPQGTLTSNTSGFCDFLDANGKWVAGGNTPPDGTVYIRRWSIEPLPTNPNNTLVLQVLVTRHRDRGTADSATGVTRLPDEARLVSAKTRKAT